MSAGESKLSLAAPKSGAIVGKALAVWALLSAATPLLVVAAYVISELARFDGVCGPYAPDISPFACDLPTYARNIFSPFAVAGMIAVGAISLIAGAVLWAVAVAMGLLLVRRT